MGFLDKAKELGAKALDGGTKAATSVMDKTGITQKMHENKIYDLAFSTEEGLRQSYLTGVSASAGATNQIKQEYGAKFTETLGALGNALPIQDYINKFVDSTAKVEFTEERIEADIQKLFQDRKAAQAELLERWKNSATPEEQAMYEKYKDEEIWVK